MPTAKTSRLRTKAPAPSGQRAPVLPVRDSIHFPGVISTLLVGRDLSLRALEKAGVKERLILVLGQRDMAVDEPSRTDLFEIGTLSEILQILPMPDGTLRLVLRGLMRCRAQGMRFRNGFFTADLGALHEVDRSGPETEALRREALESLQQLSGLGKGLAPEVVEALLGIDDLGLLADSIANHLPLHPHLKQELLEELDSLRRLERIVQILISERQVVELQVDLRSRVERELGNSQREFYLREQLRAIQNELSGPEELSAEGEELRARIEAARMPEEVQEKAMAELRRLERSPSSSPESLVIRTYIEWLAALPWAVTTEDRLNVRLAAEILEQDHYGLAKVKERILDFLAVRQLSNTLRGPVLCFVGPPGVGKTSLGRSIADAMGRKFVRISLGGVRDEAEIRGHRRTYIGSMPGRLIQGLKQCGSRNPVFMLDEVDKLASDFRGDPTSALLEALDPEQNSAFVDHYIDAPVDLSAVMFIVTANVIENIPAPLRDRMEVISFSSYTEEEKLRIARKYLLPRAIQEHGLTRDHVTISPTAVRSVIRDYTREAGVRSLEREIATVCRKVARRVAERGDRRIKVGPENLTEFLGTRRFSREHRSKNQIGVVTGLAYTEVGGETLTIEANLMPKLGDEPNLILTGSLGTVMKESALAAMTYLRAHQAEFSPGVPFAHDVHVHVPEGAVPKDGPSAGVAILAALVSAFSGRPAMEGIAMTGEITLQGTVLPVGGIREKVLAAYRAGITRVVLPKGNAADVADVPAEVREKLQVDTVAHVSEALKLVLLSPGR